MKFDISNIYIVCVCVCVGGGGGGGGERWSLFSLKWIKNSLRLHNTDLMKCNKRFRMNPNYVETGSVAHEQFRKQTDEHRTDFFVLQ